jgi:SprB repeat/Secretion system C-terminal sorting domain
MQARHILPVFILVAFFPFLLRSQCTLSVNLGADVSICRNASKTFTATPVGGTPAYTYTWSNGSHLASLTTNVSGNYAVTVTDNLGCTANDVVALTVLDTSAFILEIRAGDTAMFVSCNNKNVIVKAQPDGVVPVANFTWNTGATSQQFINAYTAGTYAVTVTAANGCETSKSITVTENKTPPNVSINPLPSTATFNCYNNQVILDGSSTTNGVTFTWSTGATNSAIAATTAGIYTLVAHNAEFGGGNGCTASTQIEVKNGIPLVDLGADRTISTGQTATLTANVTRGTGPYIYTWSNGLGNTPSVSVSNSGIYLVTVTDPIGCKSTDNIQITVQSANLTVNAGADATICKNAPKTLTAMASTGTAPYTYLWSTGATTPSVSVSNSGSFIVTVTDNNGVSGKDTVVITALDTAKFELQIRPDTALYLSCNNKNLILKAQPDGVVPVADFMWTTGATSLQFITVYQTGMYAVTVTAVNGCKSSSSVVVTSNTTPPNISILPLPANATLNCNNSQVILDAVSTTPSATFTWNTGATTSSIAATTTGIYTVTASFPTFNIGNGCSASAQIEVKNSTPSVDLGADKTLTSGQTATLTATITKGVAPFTYAWSNGLPATPSVSVSAAGTYSVTITDANGCTATDGVLVTVSSNNSLIVNAGLDATTCKNVAKTFTASVSNGVAPYTYLWSNAATTASISVKTAGNYTVTVRDANGATGTDLVVLTTLDTATFELQIRPDTALYLSCNNKNLILKAQPDGVLPVADFMWNTGATSIQFITVYETGMYAVTVTAVNGCKSSSSVVVTSNTTPPNISILPLPANATLNCNTPQVFLDAISTTPSATFTWNTGAITSSIAATTAGIYTVTAKNPEFGIGNGCTAFAQIEVKNSTPSVDLGADRTITSGQTATLTATITKGVAPFTYAWSNGLPATPSVSVSTAGTYSVTITDANGCTATDAVVVTVSTNNALIVNAGLDATTCKNVAKTFTASVSNGVAPYTYAWSNAATTSSISVKTAGNYTVTVTDATGATGSDLVVLTTLDTSNFVLQIRPDTALYLSCNNKNLILKAQPDGILPVAGFTWSNGTIDQFITVYQTGMYAVTVTAVNGCKSSSSVVVTENRESPNVTILPLPANATLNCNTPQVILDAVSTTPGVTLAWSTGAITSSIAATTAGIYTVTASFPSFGIGNGCSTSAQIEVKNSTPSVDLGADRTITSGQTATLTATITKGIAPFTYAWSNGLPATPSVSVNTAGTYKVTITDANGCTATDAVVVTVSTNNSLIVNAGLDATTCKNVAKTFTASVSNGVAPYTYLWSNAATTSSISVKTAGNYTVTVTDATGATGSDLVVLTTLDTSNFVLQIRPDTALYLSCNNKNLILKAQPDGVLPVADFMWSTGVASQQFITVYETGMYAVTVTAVNGCKSSSSVVVTANMTPPNVSILPLPANATLNCNTPQVILDAVSTTPSATFTWNTGAITSSIAATTAGIYTVTASFPSFSIGNGCTASAQIEVKNSTPSVDLGADRTIASGQTATLTATITKGIAPFTYAWSNGLPSTPSVSVSTAGTYRVTITDANGCTATDAVIVTTSGGNCNLFLSVGQTNAFCFGSNSGGIFVGYVSGGVAPYQYSFDGGLTYSSVQNKYNVAAGTYVVMVKDANNCTGSKTVVITEGAKINFTTTTTSSCGSTGSLTISNVSGGNGTPYQFAITNLPIGHPYAGAWVSTTVFNNLPPNTYFVKVRDAGSCSNQPPVSVVVGSLSGISATIAGNSTVCFGSSTTLTATTTGGIAPFTYSWIKPNASTATTQSLQGGTGSYFVTITDASGCIATASKTVTGVVSVSASITGNTSICSSTLTTLTATGLSGTAPYNFVWSTGQTGTTTNSTTGVSVTVGAGSYCVTVTDATGCSSTLCKTVTTSTLAATISSTPISATSTTLTVAPSFGLAPYLYTWNNGSTANTITVGNGIYTVTVTDASGCSVTKSATVAATSAFTLALASIKNVSCNGDATGQILTTATGGTGNNVFTITNFATTQTGSSFLNLVAGTYSVQARDGNGTLSNIVTATVTQGAAITFATAKTNNFCNGSSDGSISVFSAVGGTAPYTYSKDNGATWISTPTFPSLAANNYSIKVKDANTCTSSRQIVTVEQPIGFSFATVQDDPTCSNTTDGRIAVRYIKGGNGAPYQFSKDNGGSWQTDSIFSNLPAGTYYVKVRDFRGCNSTPRVITVTRPAPITFATTVGDVTCGFTSNGVISVVSVAGGALPYQYSRGTSFQVSPNFTGLIAGTYPIQVKDQQGCVSSIKNTVVVNSCPVIAPRLQLVPTQFIPIVITGLSPNPASDELNIDLRSLKVREQQFDFINIVGKIMISEKRQLEPGANRVSFDVSSLLPGTYFIQTLGTGEGKNQPRLFVKM